MRYILSDIFLTPGIFWLITSVVAFIILFLSYLFNYFISNSEKVSSYECGFDPDEDARNIFDVRFYIVAMLFLIFDIEAIFFFPWAASFSFLNDSGFLTMIDFLFELLFGYLYAWWIGALDWT